MADPVSIKYSYNGVPTCEDFANDDSFVRGLQGPFGCTSAATEYLTQSGWKRIDQWQKRYPTQPSWFLDRTPCGYRDPDQIRADMRAAGFADASVETVRLTGLARDALDPAVGFCQGSPMSVEIQTLEPDGLAAAIDAVAEAVVARFGQGPFTVALQALVVEATA